jgi:hypothetical protein
MRLPFDAGVQSFADADASQARVVPLPARGASGARAHHPLAILPPGNRPLQLSFFALPTLCCACRRLKARNGTWTRLKVDQQDFPGLAFSHGMCPSCIKRQYPSFSRRRKEGAIAPPTLIDW